MSKFKVSCYLLLFVLVISSTVYADKIYTWVDADGVVHYGDRPGKPDSRTIQINSHYKVDNHAVERHEKRQKILQIEHKNKQRNEAQQRLVKEKSKRVAQKCMKAKQMYASYNKAQYLYTKNENGEKQVMSSADKQKAIDEVDNYIKKWCE